MGRQARVWLSALISTVLLAAFTAETIPATASSTDASVAGSAALEDLIGLLSDYRQSGAVSAKAYPKLLARLEKAQDFRETGNLAGYEDQLESFVTQVRTRTPSQVTPEASQVLITEAMLLLDPPPPPPPPSLSVGNAAQVNEGTTLVFPVSLSSAAPPGGVTFTATTGGTGDTATAGADYTSLTSAPFSIPAGQAAVSVPVTTIDDVLFEGSPAATETVTLTINSIVGATPGSLTSVGTIMDNDSPLPSLFVADGYVDEPNVLDGANTEGNPPSTRLIGFTVQLTAPAPAGGVTFRVTTQDGTATASSDYEPLDISLTIPQGSNATAFSVFIVADLNSCEGSTETFTINISEVTGDVTVADGVGVGGIMDDDGACIP